jgi:hypothetical protein
MPVSRYSGREIIVNNDESYDELFRDRGIKQVSQYETRALYYPSNEEMVNIKFETKRWQVGDRLFKIASELYGDPRYWWVIAQFNQKPTESHFQVGDIYYVPISIEQILEFYRV